MLYVTTRDNKDAYTVHKTLLGDTAPDGGVFVPFRLPVYTQEELGALLVLNTSDIIADVLNRFFGAGVAGLSVDLAIGRNTLKVTGLSQKILVAEPWHNALQNYDFAVNNLYKLLSDSNEVSKYPTNWVKIAIKVAIIFATYSLLLMEGLVEKEASFDIAVNTEDFVDPMAVWYAKEMGIPVNKILCACTDNDGVWDLIHRSQMTFGSVSKELSSGLERLICAVYGTDCAVEYVQAGQSGKTFHLNLEERQPLSDVFFCAMMSKNRAETVSNSLQRTDHYGICTTGALAYGAVQDYRAKTGENNQTLLFSNQA